ncbi:MAG: anti-sigma factor [Bryobacteraceae bacterium]|nr:anti-sigma factor [Bryobacteraceae bacterium]
MAQLQLGDEVKPTAALRQRILSIAEPQSSGLRPLVPRWSWASIAAGVAVVLGTAALGWQLSMFRSSAEVQSLRTALSSKDREIEQLASAARPAPPPQATERVPSPPQASPVQPTAILSASYEALSRKLQEVERANATAVRDLAEQRAKLNLAETELTEKNKLLATAIQAQRAEEGKQTAALESIRKQTDDLNRRGSEAAKYLARIRVLEAEVSTYRNVIELQQQSLKEQLRLASILGSPSVGLVALNTTQSGKGAKGFALIANGSIALFASNLPQLGPGRQYQLWLMRERNPGIVSAGVFSTWGKDSPALLFTNGNLMSGIKALAITEEPAGGSRLPTGNKVLIGTRKG